MALSNAAVQNLELALQGLADALGVSLVVVDSGGRGQTRWQHPSGEEAARRADPPILPIDGVALQEGLATIIPSGKGRRFLVKFGADASPPYFVQSNDLPSEFPWTDGQLLPQVLPGCDFEMAGSAAFLLHLLVCNVCEVVVRKRSGDDSQPLNDLAVENIRRIGVCLRRKITPEAEADELARFSLQGTPAFDEFLAARRAAPPQAADLFELTNVLRDLTKGAEGSFNLMSLSGDFVIKTSNFQAPCDRIRKSVGLHCFASDIRYLVLAALAKTGAGAVEPPVFCMECHAGFTEVFAAVFVDGLIVGLVFGGQLVTDAHQARRVLEYIQRECKGTDELCPEPRVVANDNVLRTGHIVSGLAAFIARLFDRYCVARNEGLLLKALVDLQTDKIQDIFKSACGTAKRLLSVSECSAFRLEGDRLVLEATTCKQLWLRDHPKQERWKTVEAADCTGRPFYRRGEGLTGRAVDADAPICSQNPMTDERWAGLCSEPGRPSQCLLAPVRDAESNTRYGVLRGYRPGGFTQFPSSHIELFGHFALQLGTVLRNRELVQEQSQGFKRQAAALQDLLAEAVHEFRAPLHNVLQLCTAIRFATNPTAVENTHQKIKEEVYRAKRLVDNYLLRGIEGREELRYNFQPDDVGKLVIDCASRFHMTGARKGVTIRIASQVRVLPKIIMDRERIDQVLSNILDNAVKYSFDNTDIEVSANATKAHVSITITDYGLGIPREERDDIFRGYQRAVEDQGRFKPGTGLGLKIAKKIVDSHGGEIQVESVPWMADRRRLARHEGFETSFRVVLPLGGPPKTSHHVFPGL